jgi:hypothetical protein
LPHCFILAPWGKHPLPSRAKRAPKAGLRGEVGPSWRGESIGRPLA